MFGAQLDNYATTTCSASIGPAWQPQSVLLAIDERTLSSSGAASTPSAGLWPRPCA